MTEERHPFTFGPYELLGRLGQGAAGTAHLARPGPATAGVPTPVVIKRLHASVARRPELALRFRHEAEIAVRVDSAHVARVFDVGKVDEHPYIALEYVPGWTLGRLLGVVHERRRPPPLDVAADVARQFVKGLVALHAARDGRGRPLEVVHRDLSPKNLMVGDDGGVRIIDLGLGKSRQQPWKTRAGRVMGSPGYMPPEQIAGEPVDQRADIYAAAVVIYEMFAAQRYIPLGEPLSMLRATLSARPPPLSSLRPDTPPGLERVLEAALRRDAQRRTPSARAFLDELEAVLGASGALAAVAEWVRATLPAEQRARRTEVRRLLGQPRLFPEDGPELQATEIWVARDGVTHGGEFPVPGAAARSEDTRLDEAVATRVGPGDASGAGLGPTRVARGGSAATRAGRVDPTRAQGGDRPSEPGERSARSLDLRVVPSWSGREWGRLAVALLLGMGIGAAGMRVVDATLLAGPRLRSGAQDGRRTDSAAPRAARAPSRRSPGGGRTAGADAPSVAAKASGPRAEDGRVAGAPRGAARGRGAAAAPLRGADGAQAPEAEARPGPRPGPRSDPRRGREAGRPRRAGTPAQVSPANDGVPGAASREARREHPPAARARSEGGRASAARLEALTARASRVRSRAEELAGRPGAAALRREADRLASRLTLIGVIPDRAQRAAKLEDIARDLSALEAKLEAPR